MVALSNMGYCLVTNGQHEKALPLLERGLSIVREHLPGNHMDVANGETIYYRKVTNKSSGLSLYKPRPSCGYYLRGAFMSTYRIESIDTVTDVHIQ